MRKFLDFVRDAEGASALEYGVMIAALAAVIIAVIFSIGGKIDNTFQVISDTMGKPPFN